MRWRSKLSNLLSIRALAAMAIALLVATAASAERPGNKLGKEWGEQGERCENCHRTESPGLFWQWNNSQHGQNGITCLDCHGAEKGDPDSYMHKESLITEIVSPKDCGQCHTTEVKEHQRSHHASGGEILASLDNLLGEVVGGPAAVNAGCRQCHGSVIEVFKDGKRKGHPTPQTWPNTGIGRINPDGSKGTCSACHGRHGFSRAQARTPDTCGKCHIGPDHPQIEVYNESKHGIIYRASVDQMNMDKDKWVAGIDYVAAPTCATCHMSASPDEGKTHDVGERISWNLRSPISKKINLVRLDNGHQYDVPEGKPLPKKGDKPDHPKAHGGTVVEILTWKDRRDKMQDICYACHTSSFVDGHYKQLDDLVDLYNEKFAKPIAAIMSDLKKAGKLSKAPFDEKLEWVWWEIWHHEGRRARHGASMNGPDYTWWHGIYDVAKHTYFKFIPELKKKVGDKMAGELLDKHFRLIPGHTWFFEGMSKEAIDKVRKGYEERYGKGSLK